MGCINNSNISFYVRVLTYVLARILIRINICFNHSKGDPRDGIKFPKTQLVLREDRLLLCLGRQIALFFGLADYLLSVLSGFD